jgi:hypothetical protein
LARIEVATFIAADADAVWHVIADLERQAEWMVDVRRLRLATAQTRGEGAIIEVTSELFGLPLVRDIMLVTRWDPPRRMEVEHRGQFHGTGTFALDAAENGTVFTWTEDVRPPLGPLGEAAFRLVIRPHLARVFARSLANVKRMAERGEG